MINFCILPWRSSLICPLSSSLRTSVWFVVGCPRFPQSGKLRQSSFRISSLNPQRSHQTPFWWFSSSWSYQVHLKPLWKQKSCCSLSWAYRKRGHLCPTRCNWLTLMHFGPKKVRLKLWCWRPHLPGSWSLEWKVFVNLTFCINWNTTAKMDEKFLPFYITYIAMFTCN